MNPARKYPRIKCNLIGEIVSIDSELPRPVMIVQIGQGGCLFLPRGNVEENRVFMLDLLLPDSQIRMICRVKYHYEFDDGVYVGVEFEDSDDAPKELVEFIKSQIPVNAIWLPGENETKLPSN